MEVCGVNFIADLLVEYQVPVLLQINLLKADVNSVISSNNLERLLLFEDILNRSLQQPPFLIGILPFDGVGFSRAGLTVREDAYIEPID